MKAIRCRCCGIKLISGRKFYPLGNSKYVCEYCKAPAQEPEQLYVSTDEFTGFVPVLFREAIDNT